MTKSTKYLKGYSDKQLLQTRKDAEKVITSGKLIGRAEPYLNLIRDINYELVKRISK